MENNKTLYNQIAEYLKDKIRNSELMPGEKLPTEMKLAEMFNVSRITSKKALEELEKENLIYRRRGSGSFVSNGKKSSEIPKETIKNNLVKPKVIAFILPFDSTSGRLIDTIKGAAEILESRQYYLTLNNAGRSTKREKELLSELYTSDIRGIIYYPKSDSKNLDLLYLLSVYEYPLVVIDKSYESISLSYVVSDNFDGGYKAAEQLIKLRHKRIGFVSDIKIEDATSVRKRYFGYCKALTDNGIFVDNEIVEFGLKDSNNSPFEVNNFIENLEQKQGLKNMLTYLRDKGVTAIQAINDYIAINLIHACSEMNIKVPEQLSIIGFDNIETSAFPNVELSTIEQNFYEIGRHAAQILLDKIEHGSSNHVQRVLPVKLIERKSYSMLLK